MIIASWTTFSAPFLGLESAKAGMMYLVNKKTFNEKSNLAKII